MKHITTDFDGDLVVDGYVGVSGIVAGSVEVAAGRFTLTGSVLEDVIVHDGLANIYGTVHGDIVNHGGRVVVAGSVGGALRGGHGIEVSSSAIVGRPPIEPALEPIEPPAPPPEPRRVSTITSRSDPDGAHAKWRQFRGGAGRRPVMPWKYAPASPNPGLRVRRWWRFVWTLAALALAAGLLWLAVYFGSRNDVPQAADTTPVLKSDAETWVQWTPDRIPDGRQAP